ncbi:MAG: cupin domain-containing protein [Chitinophagaceae bacterium]
MEKINLLQKFGLFSEHWSPKIIGELNHQQIKLGKFQGEFVWHKHENEDEAFFVMKGSFNMELRDKTIELNEGDMLVVPKGVEHRPVAENEAWVMMFEPATTLNTGNVINEKTKTVLEKI